MRYCFSVEHVASPTAEISRTPFFSFLAVAVPKRNCWSLFTAALILTLVAQTTWGATYYVDVASGNDAWSGKFPDPQATDGPWKTIGRVNGAALLPGDTVLFRRGQTWNDFYLNVPKAGAPNNPIVFGAYGEGPKPTIDVQGAHSQAFVSYRSYITVRDMAFKNSLNTAVGFAVTGGAYGISLIDIDVEFDPGVSYGNNGVSFTKGGDGIYLSGVRVVNAQNNGILFYGSAANNIGNVVVERSVVLGTRANDCFTVHEDSSGNPAGSNFTFVNNYAEGCAEQGYDITSGHNILLKNNVSRNSGEGSVIIGHSAESVRIEAHESYDEPTKLTSAAINIKSRDVQMVNSVISGRGYHLLSISDGTKFRAENVDIINNTFVWNGGNSIFDMSGVSENIKILNNIFTSGAADGIASPTIVRFLEQSRPPDYPSFVFDHNIYYFPDGNQRFLRTLVNGSSWANFDFSGFNQFGQELSGATGNPSLAGRTTGDYKLTEGSIAIDGGEPISGLAADHEGLPRFGTPDIGAFEFQSSDLAISLAGSANSVLTESPFSYSGVVSNSGPSTANGVVVTLTLPNGVNGKVSSSQGSCSGVEIVTCAIGTLPSGSNATISVFVVASPEGVFDETPDTVLNQVVTTSVSVAANETDPSTANNSATASTTITLACQGLPVTQRGTGGVDSMLLGTSGNDVIHGLSGDDWIDGNNGADRICGGVGNDDLYGGRGNDALFGEDGNDNLNGGNGSDTCDGGIGTNTTNSCP